MPQTLIKPRYNPKYKIKPTTEKLKFKSSTTPSNLQNFIKNYSLEMDL